MGIIILCCVTEIFMTFLCMAFSYFTLVSSFTFDGLCDEMFDAYNILVSFFFWWALLPCYVTIWLIRLIAYPFRKKWR